MLLNFQRRQPPSKMFFVCTCSQKATDRHMHHGASRPRKRARRKSAPAETGLSHREVLPRGPWLLSVGLWPSCTGITWEPVRNAD